MPSFTRRTRALIPTDLQAYVLISIALLFSAGIYYLRTQADSFFLGWGRGALFHLASFWGEVLILCVLFLCYIRWSVSYAFRKKQVLPLLMLGGSILLSTCAPVPSPSLYEEALFRNNREKYEQMVKMALNNELGNNAECRKFFLAPPAGYENLAAKCIRVGKKNGIYVNFMPRSYYRPIVYFQDRVAITYHPACSWPDGQILKQLDANWFVCQEDFN